MNANEPCDSAASVQLGPRKQEAVGVLSSSCHVIRFASPWLEAGAPEVGPQLHRQRLLYWLNLAECSAATSGPHWYPHFLFMRSARWVSVWSTAVTARSPAPSALWGPPTSPKENGLELSSTSRLLA